MKTLTRFLVILCGAIFVAASNGANYVFPVGDGFVSVDIPTGWTNASGPESISFGSPDGLAALTVTAHSSASLSPKDVEQVNSEVRPFGLPTSEKRELKFRPSGSYRQEFRGEGKAGDIYWVSDFLFFPEVTVIASLNGPKEFIEKEQAVVRSILDSVQTTKDQKKSQPNKTPLPTPVECPPSNHGQVPGAADL
ncbi:MAG: hypothetical protein IPL39_02445 [Opitutaceae bacterium]|nr:hypothetical protein [Opitutaceae bacterium]